MVIGHTAQLNTVGYPPELQVLGTGYADTQLSLGRYSNSSSGCQVSIVKSRATSGVGGPSGSTIVQDDDQLGLISWQGDDGTTTDSRAASIDCFVDGTPGENNMPGRLVFMTNGGTSGPTERMRIDKDGAIVGTTSASAKTIHSKNSHGTPYGISVDYTGAAPNSNSASMFLGCRDTSATRLNIYSDGTVSTAAGNTLVSDERLKTNIVDASDKLADVMKLQVRNSDWTPEYHPNKEGEKKIGFIAQELETVFPSLIMDVDIAPDNSIEEELYDAEDDIPEGKVVGDVKVAAKDHEPAMRKSVKDAFAPILVKALQEVTTRLEAAEAKIAALEAA